ncbi:MAG: hypothetical protein ACI9LX_003340 [Paraglaciecola sp.]|jgi:hypothetical protein
MYIKTGTCAGRTKLNHPDWLKSLFNGRESKARFAPLSRAASAVISPRNKPLFAKTLKAETAEAEPPKRYLKNRFFFIVFIFCFIPRIYVRQLFMRFRRVKLDNLEAQLRPFELLDKLQPWTVEGGRWKVEQCRSNCREIEKSRLLRGNRVPIIRDV